MPHAECDNVIHIAHYNTYNKLVVWNSSQTYICIFRRNMKLNHQHIRLCECIVGLEVS